MSLMGLDISLTSTGYSIDGSTGLIKVNSRGAQRLHEISQAVLVMCSEYSIDTVILEGYSFASRNSQAHSIGELGGCIRMRLWENTIPYVEVPPTSRAKFATGKGNAGKQKLYLLFLQKLEWFFLALERMTNAMRGSLNRWDWPNLENLNISGPKSSYLHLKK